jgi:hypothetical protein
MEKWTKNHFQTILYIKLNYSLIPLLVFLNVQGLLDINELISIQVGASSEILQVYPLYRILSNCDPYCLAYKLTPKMHFLHPLLLIYNRQSFLNYHMLDWKELVVCLLNSSYPKYIQLLNQSLNRQLELIANSSTIILLIKKCIFTHIFNIFIRTKSSMNIFNYIFLNPR